ncbi:hypothetical protein CSC67_08525 [Pusillimonas caeni]|uniref:hypothetical protein n=1 Tax=Pusillimonas caeni TaxID=1348472 RepID=UPI000E59F955|nr:hypothetical protein [Pusillimonas caeni]TFL14187.1 hypothetical protein CSC67_08525 [Pusillimonas caeni]
MDDNKKDHVQPPNDRTAALIDGIEQLSLTISTLRSWAVCPSLFDHIGLDDRQNLLLAVLEHAEAAQEKLLQVG